MDRLTLFPINMNMLLVTRRRALYLFKRTKNTSPWMGHALKSHSNLLNLAHCDSTLVARALLFYYSPIFPELTIDKIKAILTE